MESTEFSDPVTLIGGAPFDPRDLETARKIAPVLLAADSGADRLAALGLRPDLIIGDMDSMRGAVPDGVDVRWIEEQDTTDFEKCLLHSSAPFYLGLGFVGGRLDHTLAALHSLIAHPDRTVILIGPEDICFVAPPAFAIRLAPGTRVSIYPVAPCNALRSSGLRWPLDGLSLKAGDQIATSNQAVDELVSMQFDAAGAVLLLPKPELGAVLAALEC